MSDANIHIEIKKWGNSLAVIIPAKTAQELNLEEGTTVDLEIRKCERVDGFGIFKGAKSFRRETDHRDKDW